MLKLKLQLNVCRLTIITVYDPGCCFILFLLGNDLGKLTSLTKGLKYSLRSKSIFHFRSSFSFLFRTLQAKLTCLLLFDKTYLVICIVRSAVLAYYFTGCFNRLAIVIGWGQTSKHNIYIHTLWHQKGLKIQQSEWIFVLLGSWTNHTLIPEKLSALRANL